MAKMLMGQIDHARDRIKQITAEKLGVRPETPERLDADALMAKVRSGALTLAPSQLKLALSNYIGKVPVEVVKSSGGNYNYRSSRQEGARYHVAEVVRDTLSECIADVILGYDSQRAVLEWKRDYDAYVIRKETLAAEATTVEDAIVLGDQAAALAALTAFAAFTP